jgi:hypothetical protein
MTEPGDSNLMAKAITSRSGQRNKSAIAEKQTSTILFRIKPMLALEGGRGAAELVGWTPLWRTACPHDELHRPKACGRR